MTVTVTVTVLIVIVLIVLGMGIVFWRELCLPSICRSRCVACCAPGGGGGGGGGVVGVAWWGRGGGGGMEGWGWWGWHEEVWVAWKGLIDSTETRPDKRGRYEGVKEQEGDITRGWYEGVI